VGRGVREARQALHETAVYQNGLNEQALKLVSAMEWIDAPYAEGGQGRPLSDHTHLASEYLLTKNREYKATSGQELPFWDRLDVMNRLDEFLEVVAGRDDGTSDARHGTEYFNDPYAIHDSHKREQEVRRLVIDPTKEVIRERMAEVADIVVETASLKTRVAARLHLPSARSLVQALGVSQGAAQTLV
jgi:hypothetical protein